MHFLKVKDRVILLLQYKSKSFLDKDYVYSVLFLVLSRLTYISQKKKAVDVTASKHVW